MTKLKALLGVLALATAALFGLPQALPKLEAFVKILEWEIERINAGVDRHEVLLHAISEEETEALGLLIYAGADVNDPGKDGDDYPIIWAVAFTEDTAVLEMLIKAGADANQSIPDNGGTPLMLAALMGKKETAQFLVDRGADVEAANKGGGTVMMAAASRGHADVVRLLLEAGADPSRVNQDGNTALSLAEEGGHPETVSLLKAHT